MSCEREYVCGSAGSLHVVLISPHRGRSNSVIDGRRFRAARGGVVLSSVTPAGTPTELPCDPEEH